MSSQKKRITPASDASTVEPSPPLLPGQWEFHHYLRSLAQSAVRTVIEAVMREELEAFIVESNQPKWVVREEVIFCASTSNAKEFVC